MPLTLARLRADAIRRTFFTPTTLPAALHKLGFVQADPIRSPARAQDLILRHRVQAYRAGDLERRYPRLNIEEDFFYAYGFLTRPNWSLLHPRVMDDLSPLDRRVLDAVTRNGQVHPRELEKELGRDRVVNYWGGHSKATTKSLQLLHYRGLIRVARRDNGIRVYEPASLPEQPLPPKERVRRMALLIARILAPLPVRSLWETLRLLKWGLRGPELPPSIIQDLIGSGVLDTAHVEGLHYVWPAARIIAPEPARVVRFLAPFDPLVWDRRRFQHFFGWSYRFEAYTPGHKRVRGYYAMPVLWGDEMVGWANAGGPETLKVKFGWARKRPTAPAFRAALDEELDRFRTFLKLN